MDKTRGIQIKMMGGPSAWSVLGPVPHVLFVAALLGRCGSLPCFPDEDTKVQRGPVTWPRPHGSGETEPGLEPRLGPSPHAFEGQ